MDYNAALNDANTMLTNRATLLRELETKAKRAGNIIQANQLGQAASELGLAANQLRAMKQK